MLFSLIFFIIIQGITSSKCPNVNATVCSSDQCPGYSMVNSSCTATCTQSQYFDSNISNCSMCMLLSESDCPVKCPNFYYNKILGSIIGTCSICSSKYGESCSKCMDKTCLACYPGMVLNSDNLGCRDSTCTIDYCKICGQSGQCLTCMTGFKYNNSSMKCQATNCSIDGCDTCSGFTCATCMEGYTK